MPTRYRLFCYILGLCDSTLQCSCNLWLTVTVPCASHFKLGLGSCSTDFPEKKNVFTAHITVKKIYKRLLQLTTVMLCNIGASVAHPELVVARWRRQRWGDLYIWTEDEHYGSELPGTGHRHATGQPRQAAATEGPCRIAAACCMLLQHFIDCFIEKNEFKPFIQSGP